MIFRSVARKVLYFNTSLLYTNFRKMTTDCKSRVALETVLDALKSFAPLSLSEKWDNTGLLIQPYTARSISKIMLTNDFTEDVLEEAIANNAELVISYHPVIFSGLKSITREKWQERVVARCLEEKISLYSPHTSWDSVMGGVNEWLADCLPEHSKQPIVEGQLPNTGPGRLCSLEKATTLQEIVKSVKSHVGLTSLQLGLARGGSLSSEIKTVALCAGSGASVFSGVKADLFITGEMSHHAVLEAVHNGTSVILTNHSNSERGFLRVFAPKLKEMLKNEVEVFVSKRDRDPLQAI